MAIFVIVEERTETYTARIEASSMEEAKRLYYEDSEEIFGDQWEQADCFNCELREIVELAEDELNTKTAYIFENGEIQDIIDGPRSGE